jgi:hypothetical protein
MAYLAAMVSPHDEISHSGSATIWWCESRSSQRISRCRGGFLKDDRVESSLSAKLTDGA